VTLPVGQFAASACARALSGRKAAAAAAPASVSMSRRRMRELLIRFLPIVAQQLTLAFGQSSKIAMVRHRNFSPKLGESF
jgi:hypothetical protein